MFDTSDVLDILITMNLKYSSFFPDTTIYSHIDFDSMININIFFSIF